jgi:hypothetical protein
LSETKPGKQPKPPPTKPEPPAEPLRDGASGVTFDDVLRRMLGTPPHEAKRKRETPPNGGVT